MTRTRLLACALALAACAFQASVVQAASATLTLTAPKSAPIGLTTALALKLPAGVSAVDGRLLFDSSALELVGVAPGGAGTAFAPVVVNGGAAFGAYGLNTAKATTLNLVVVAHVAARIQVNVSIDSMAGASGARLTPTQVSASTVLVAGNGTGLVAAPSGAVRPQPLRAATPARTLVGLRTLTMRDLGAISADWTDARLNSSVCGTATSSAADANGDGCVDIVDVAAINAGIGKAAAVNPAVTMVSSAISASSIDAQVSSTNAVPSKGAALTYSHTFTVNYAGDTADANPGDGFCADSQGRCSLRAAMQESNWSKGPDFIGFNIAGTAPVTIALTSSLPLLNDQSGGTTIDAYTQPGAKVNSAQYGSNAVPGIVLQGTANSPRGQAFYITSSDNMIRGFDFYRSYRQVVMDGSSAHDNYIVGNWFGVTGTGALSSYQSDLGIYMQQGANNNHIGTSDLADRNVIGTATKAIFLYGQGTDNNVIQDNDLCMTPSGGQATCSTGVDHDFAPNGTQIGGFGTNEKNVIGPTLLNGVEISHGWNPVTKQQDTAWLNKNIHIEGNWIGFRMDGSYSASYRSGLNNPGTADNGNGINIYDGCLNNVANGNYIASAYDGINTMRPNCSGNSIINNVIGVSPLGQAAPMSWWGIHVRLSTYDDLVQGNTIRNATKGGIGLTSVESGVSGSGGERYIRISQNIISDTNGPAIYLTPSSGSDAPGSNNLYASPVITTATTASVSGTGIAGSTVEVYQASRNAGLSGLPIAYLGSGTVANDGTWTVPITIAQNTQVTALEIAPNGNTSMLGTNVAVTYVAPPPAPVASYTWSQESGNLNIDFTDTSSNTPTTWSWDFGDGSSATVPNPVHTYAAAGDYSVKLTVANGGGSDSKTSTVTVNPLSGPTIYAADAFGRSVSGGWGNADTGGAYTLQTSASNFSVGSGVGSMIVPAAGKLSSALLNGVSQQDVDLTFRFTVDKAPSGGAYWIYAVARRNGNNEYRAKVRMLADGRVGIQASKVINNAESMIGSEVIVAGLSVTPGSFIWVHAQVLGSGTTTFNINAWADGQSQPAGWQYTSTDSTASLQSAGGLGLRSIPGSGRHHRSGHLLVRRLRGGRSAITCLEGEERAPAELHHAQLGRRLPLPRVNTFWYSGTPSALIFSTTHPIICRWLRCGRSPTRRCLL